MHLVNFPKIRIRRKGTRYVVEIQRTFLGVFKYWSHIVSVMGYSGQPWYYHSKEGAINDVANLFMWDLIYYNRHIK